MSKPKYAAVLTTISTRLSSQDPSNRSVWLFEVDENYSLDAVKRFFKLNEATLGGPFHVRHEMMRFKSIRKLLAWADRKGRNIAGLPPLTGWNGPLRLAGA